MLASHELFSFCENAEPPSPNFKSVKEFYAGKTVAITGGTGFLGQGIIEKLLRCCPDIQKIILFIREKKDQQPNERLEALAQLAAFQNLRKIYPNFVEKLFCVSCDLQASDLGLSCESQELLKNEVNIVIHCAATLKFNENLRLSFDTNVRCVQRIIQLCKSMKHLNAFVHISTAYSHCNQKRIEEKFYENNIDYRDLESALKWMSDENVEKVTEQLLADRPNTYTLTKALAEDVIVHESGNLPVCIVRPSMVIPALAEPAPGWCTNMYGPTGFIVAYAKGVLRTMVADGSVVADLIPVDLVVSGVIAAAMKTAHDHHLNLFKSSTTFAEEMTGDSDSEATIVNIKKNIPIYHLTTGNRNPLLIEDLVRIGKLWADVYPLDPLRSVNANYTTNIYLHETSQFFQQTVPAYLADAVLVLCNKKTQMIRLNQKLSAGMDVLKYFFTNGWEWTGENTFKLQAYLSPEDQKVFNFDAASYDWNDQIKNYIIGTRKYILKEDMTKYEQARKSVQRLRIISNCVDSAAVLGVFGLASVSGVTQSAFKLAASTWTTLSNFM